MLGASFGRNHVSNLKHQISIPGGGEADGLWEHRGVTRTSNSVQSLVPPFIVRNTQTVDSGRTIHHLRDLFLERHARNEIVDAFVDREGRVFVGWNGLLLSSSS